MKPVITAIVLFIVIFSVMFEFTSFDRTAQKKLIERNSLKENASAENDKVLDFFKTGVMEINMSENELSHMQDVRRLNNYFKLFMWLMVCVLGIMIYLNPDIWSIVSKMWIPLTAFVIISGVCALFPSQIFSLFHKIFFPQGNYLFSESSFLISLYPEKYFFELFFVIAARTIIIAAVIFSANIFSKRMFKK